MNEFEEETGTEEEEETPKKKGRPKSSAPSHLMSLVNTVFGEDGLFMTPSGEPYAHVTDPDSPFHGKTIPMKKKEFGTLLRYLYNIIHPSENPGITHIGNVIEYAICKAYGNPVREEVFIRIAPDNTDGIYIDRGDEEHTVFHITDEGWTIEHDAPVKFIQPAGMLPLPMPVAPDMGNLGLLKNHLNAKSEDDFCMIVAFILASINPYNPYPPLFISGPPGAAKTTATRIIRCFIDPNDAYVVPPTDDIKDMIALAGIVHVPAYENVTHLTKQQQSLLCIAATGGKYVRRELFTTNDANVASYKKPVIINGIASQLATQGDLVDRLISVSLNFIPEDDRKVEKRLWPEIHRDAPAIYGGILDALVCCVRNYESTLDNLQRMPRMADFYAWIIAGEEKLPWPKGYFAETYTLSKASDADGMVESDIISRYFLDFASAQLIDDNSKKWESPTEFYKSFKSYAVHKATEEEELGTLQTKFPISVGALTTKLRTSSPQFEQKGYRFESKPGRTRTINISKI